MTSGETFACIMAGGVGKRFWPLSRRALPKHLLSFIGEKTLLQDTAERLAGILGWDRIIVVTTMAHMDLVADQLPEIAKDSIIAEPEGRNTAACIGLGLRWLIVKGHESATVGFFPSDHLIPDRTAFKYCFERAVQLSDSGAIVVFGIKPASPETGYGYIETGLPFESVDSAWRVSAFHEKPDYDTAENWIQTGRFFWNSGMFVSRVAHFWDELERFMPRTASKLIELGDDFSRDALALQKEKYTVIDSISIDYGVMERTTDLLMVSGDFDWDDLGSWEAVSAYWPGDEYNNKCKGEQSILIDSTGCRIYSTDRLVAVVGMENTIVVQSDDAVLICPRRDAQKVKKLVQFLEENAYEQYL